MSDDVILLEVADGIATVTLNRPQAMNALNRALRKRLAEVMRTVDADDAVRAVILTGAGERAFTAGLDLKELGSEAGALGSANATDPADNPVKAIELCRKPVIGAINGVAITGGFEVALACDVLVASTKARFADTHARVGIVPGWGLSQKLSRMIGISRAKELAFTGNFLDAATAHSWGLVNHVVAPDELLPLAQRLAGEWRVICPDMRGRAESAYAKDPMSYVPLTYLQDIGRLLADLAITRFVAVGTSLGGIITMLVAAISHSISRGRRRPAHRHQASASHQLTCVTG